RSEVSVTNLDDDFIGIVLDKPSITTSETGTSAEVKLVLNTQPTAAVGIDFSGVDVSEDKISVNSISFTPDNWNIPQSVIFTGVDDDIVDGNVKFTVKASAQSLDQNYQGKSADLEVINTDNDFDGLVLSALNLTTSESGTKDTLSIALSTKPASNVSVKLSGLDSSEGSLSTNTLQFTASNWDQAQPVTVTGVDDNFNDGNIRYTLTASAVSNDTYFSNKKAFVTVENLDNEGPGLKFSSDTAQTSESGTSALLSLVLSSQPVGEVTVTLSGVDDTEGQLLTGTQLTFNANDWDHPHSIIVQGVDDPDPDGDIRYTLLASATSSDQQYQNKTATLIITNL
ncbi:MAG: hypothetical protein EBR59_11440, partial [Methylococcaceae bacterium]|nr:hypothetical protein [Methylococcaceae bacterium]